MLHSGPHPFQRHPRHRDLAGILRTWQHHFPVSNEKVWSGAGRS